MLLQQLIVSAEAAAGEYDLPGLDGIAVALPAGGMDAANGSVVVRQKIVRRRLENEADTGVDGILIQRVHDPVVDQAIALPAVGMDGDGEGVLHRLIALMQRHIAGIVGIHQVVLAVQCLQPVHILLGVGQVVHGQRIIVGLACVLLHALLELLRGQGAVFLGLLLRRGVEHHAAGIHRRAAGIDIRLHHGHGSAGLRRLDGRAQPGAACADDHDIRVDGLFMSLIFDGRLIVLGIEPRLLQRVLHGVPDSEGTQRRAGHRVQLEGLMLHDLGRERFKGIVRDGGRLLVLADGNISDRTGIVHRDVHGHLAVPPIPGTRVGSGNRALFRNGTLRGKQPGDQGKRRHLLQQLHGPSSLFLSHSFCKPTISP